MTLFTQQAHEFERRTQAEMAEFQRERQKDFLLLGKQIMQELGIESFGWNQLNEFNDENHEVVYLMDPMYIYINGKNHSWDSDGKEEDDDKRQTIYDILSNIREETMQMVFGCHTVMVYKDRIELEERW